MPDVTIVYWRDYSGAGDCRQGPARLQGAMPERFEQAIDRAAMKSGAAETDDYLAEWRKADPYSVEGEPAEVAAAEAARLDAEFDPERIKALIANDGRA